MTIQSIQSDYNNTSVEHGKKTVSANEMYRQLFEQKLSEQAEIIRNRSTEKTIPLGGTAFTTEEWEKMLADFDVTMDDLREQMRIEHAKAEDEKLQKLTMKEE
jgi:hypothetical protein